MVMNLEDLKIAMKESILDPLDHKHLDLDVFKNPSMVSTTENLAVFIWDSLSSHPKIPPGYLHAVKINETDKNLFIYKGESQ